MKTKIISALFVAGTAMASQSAFATDGTITFNGSVTDTTCKINGGDRGDFAVNLPVASATNLKNVGDTAMQTPFDITLSGCDGNAIKVSAYFEPGSTITTDGKLMNTAGAGAATNVEIQLLNKADRSAIVLGAAQESQNSAQVSMATGATLSYYAQYYATGQVTSGTVTSTVTYTLAYL